MNSRDASVLEALDFVVPCEQGSVLHPCAGTAVVFTQCLQCGAGWMTCDRHKAELQALTGPSGLTWCGRCRNASRHWWRVFRLVPVT